MADTAQLNCEQILRRVRAHQLALTARQRSVLRTMAAHPHGYEGEIVMEGRRALLGDEPIAVRTVYALIRALAIRSEEPAARFSRWQINETGARLAKEYKRG